MLLLFFVILEAQFITSGIPLSVKKKVFVDCVMLI